MSKFPFHDAAAEVETVEKDSIYFTDSNQTCHIIPRFLLLGSAICLSQLTTGKMPFGTFG